MKREGRDMISPEAVTSAAATTRTLLAVECHIERSVRQSANRLMHPLVRSRWQYCHFHLRRRPVDVCQLRYCLSIVCSIHAQLSKPTEAT